MRIVLAVVHSDGSPAMAVRDLFPTPLYELADGRRAGRRGSALALSFLFGPIALDPRRVLGLFGLTRTTTRFALLAILAHHDLGLNCGICRSSPSHGPVIDPRRLGDLTVGSAFGTHGLPLLLDLLLGQMPAQDVDRPDEV
jgi:hypothetical protein